MKNILWTVAFVALAGSVFAVNPSKKTLTFSTQGPDLYADGTPVLDNEQYALVYVAPNKTFGGFYTDGKLVNTADNQLLCAVPAALNGKCSPQPVQFYPSTITKPQGGKFIVVMMDTRVPDAVKTGKLGKLVMGWGVAGETAGVSAPTTVVDEVAVQQASQVTGDATLPQDVVPPVITGIQVKGNKVIVTAQMVSPNAYYELNATDDVKKDKSQWDRSKSVQKGDNSGVIELEYPITESSKLFKVVIPK